MGVKVAVVGGGSTYTPELVEGFVTRGDRLPVDELVLLDIDPERLAIVGALADRMMRRAGWSGKLRLTGDRDEALEGADFVIVQLRVGGQAARFLDETIPPRFGCIGQETTGPGGFAKALRTVPVVLELAEETAARGARARGSSTSRTPRVSSPRRCWTTGIARSASATSRSASSGSSRSASASRPSGCSWSTSG